MSWSQWHESKTFYAVERLPNGWSAMVIDDSQACAPTRTTQYRIAASSARLHIPWTLVCETLGHAKHESLKRALALPRAAETDAEALEQFYKYSPMSIGTRPTKEGIEP